MEYAGVKTNSQSIDTRAGVKLIEQHFRVTVALIARETSTRYGSKPSGFLRAIFDPVAHVTRKAMEFALACFVVGLTLSVREIREDRL